MAKLTLEQRAVWIVCLEIAYVRVFKTIVNDQSEMTCNQSMRFWEGWIEELRDS